MTDVCRSCPARIIWTTSPAGAALPLDATPRRLRPKAQGERGLVGYEIAYPSDQGPKAISLGMFVIDERAVGKQQGFSLVGTIEAYVSHFATCPNAGQHSRRPR